MSCNRRARQRGFTLIEAVASLGLLSVAAAAVGVLVTSQIRMQDSNANRTQAISLAAKEFEDLRSLDYSSIPTSRSSTVTVGGVTYSVASRATFNYPSSGVASVVTTVSWNELLGAQSYTVYGLYTDVTR